MAEINFALLKTNKIDGGSIKLLSYLFSASFLFSSTLTTQWVRTNGPYDNSYVRALVISDSSLIAGTYDRGVFRSTDNGSTWTYASSDLNPTVLTLAVYTFDSVTYLFASTSDGNVYRSTDHGSTWAWASNGLNMAHIYSFASYIFDGVIYLFAGTYNGVYRSTDHGASWISVGNGLPAYDVSSLAAYVSGGETYLFVGMNGGGIFRSIDQGATWTAANIGVTSIYINSFAVYTSEGSTNLFAGTGIGGVFLSTNNGASWSAINNGLTVLNVYSLAVSDTNLFAGISWGGVFYSTNSGENWFLLNSGLTGQEIRAFAISRSDSGLYVFAGPMGDVVHRIFISKMNDIGSISPLNPYDNEVHVRLDNTVNFPGSTELSWEYTEGTIVTLSARLQVSIDSNFFYGMIVDSIVKSAAIRPTRHVSVSKLTSKTTYYWRVSLVYEDGSITPWSDIWRFTTIGGLITGVLFDDLDRDGFRDEEDIGLIKFKLLMSGNAEGDILTDSFGGYAFAGLDSGYYTITVAPLTSWTLTYPDSNRYSFYLGPDSVKENIDFGLSYPWNSISGYVFNDENEDGIKSENDSGISSWSVQFAGIMGKDSILTSDDGYYSFPRLSVGACTVYIAPPHGWEQIYPRLGKPYVNLFYDYNNQISTNFSFHKIPPRVKTILNFHDNRITPYVRLQWGARQAATNGIWGADPKSSLIDYSEGELEIPPQLPGALDARFVKPPNTDYEFGMGSWIDIRPYLEASQVDTYSVSFYAGTYEGGDFPVTFYWSAEQISDAYSSPVWLIVPPELIIDMRDSDSIVITDSDINRIRIIAMGPNMPPADVQQGGDQIPSDYRLGQAYPNPFNPSTTILYQLPENSKVSLKVYNTLGQLVINLTDQSEEAGFKSVEWNASSVASGVYFYRLEATSVSDPSKTFTQVKKMLLVK